MVLNPTAVGHTDILVGITPKPKFIEIMIGLSLYCLIYRVWVVFWVVMHVDLDLPTSAHDVTTQMANINQHLYRHENLKPHNISKNTMIAEQ
jgi:hypothetical protein